MLSLVRQRPRIGRWREQRPERQVCSEDLPDGLQILFMNLNMSYTLTWCCPRQGFLRDSQHGLHIPPFYVAVALSCSVSMKPVLRVDADRMIQELSKDQKNVHFTVCPSKFEFLPTESTVNQLMLLMPFKWVKTINHSPQKQTKSTRSEVPLMRSTPPE